MMTRLCVVCLIAIGKLSAQAVEPDTTERWISICRPLADATVNADGTIIVPKDFEAGRCAGAFDTINTLAGLIGADGKPVLGVCLASNQAYLKNRSIVQWATMFIDYAKRHPQRYQESFADVMIATLQEMFPCPKK